MNFRHITPIWFDEIDSTNAEAMRMLKSGKPPEGTCICARYQHQGKGQRANQWNSQHGQNLLVSFVFYPPAHAAQQPFLLSEAIALAVHRTLKQFTPQPVEIKWPNDVLISEKKASGVLIENQWLGSNWHAAIVGIGINVNQLQFDVEHATSLAACADKEISIDAVLDALRQHISVEYLRVQRGAYDEISSDYNEHLFGREGFRTYITAHGTIQAKVLHVSNNGQLKLLTAENAICSFDLSEVRLVY
jgi:BirA family biotin operon repressor/biotin-[acetyl-CoA-carboxylase] ligase